MGKLIPRDAARVAADQEKAKPEEKPSDSMYASDIPSDILFPDQLNRYFRDQIHSLTLENGGLRRSLEEMQEELTATKDKLMKATQPIPVGRVAEVADCKIAQLSKRLREQNAELESLRTQVKEAEAKLRRMEDKASEEEGESTTGSIASPNELAEKEKQIKALTEKLQASNAKICDFRNQYQALKQEMKLAQKVLENEVGEKCSLQDLSKENGSWRGRAQQILTLQNKVQMLQEQLNHTGGTDNPASSILRQIEKDRRANYEETSKQLNQKIIQVEEMRKKLEAAKARNKVLENEVLQVKTKMAAMAEKEARDEHLLSTLTSQINAFEDRGKAQMQCFAKMQENVTKLHQELELERTKSEQLQRAIADREARIYRMKEQMEEMKKNVVNKVRGTDDEYEKFYETADKCVNTSPQQERTIPSTAETEKTRLLELLAVTNRRLDESRREQNQAECQLRKERYKNAKLETKIARLELEKLGALKTGRGSYSQGTNRTDSPNTTETDILAQQHIEYLEEERLALKTRIETLQMEREEDLKMLSGLGEGFNDRRPPRWNADTPPEGNPCKEKRTKLPGKILRRSPVNSFHSSNVRQTSFSEELQRYDRSPDHRISHQ